MLSPMSKYSVNHPDLFDVIIIVMKDWTLFDVIINVMMDCTSFDEERQVPSQSQNHTWKI
jgi:hypothetical protein